MQMTQSKLAKNQFKCFQCRKVFASKNGDWFNWNTMQVHLCEPCQKVTKDKPERNHVNAKY